MVQINLRVCLCLVVLVLSISNGVVESRYGSSLSGRSSSSSSGRSSSSGSSSRSSSSPSGGSARSSLNSRSSSSSSSGYGSMSSLAQTSSLHHSPLSQLDKSGTSGTRGTSNNQARRTYPVTDRPGMRYGTNRPNRGGSKATYTIYTERPHISGSKTLRPTTNTARPNTRKPMSSDLLLNSTTSKVNRNKFHPVTKNTTTTNSFGTPAHNFADIEREHEKSQRNSNHANEQSPKTNSNAHTERPYRSGPKTPRPFTNTTRSNTRHHNTTINNSFGPSAPSFADIEREHETSPRNPVDQHVPHNSQINHDKRLTHTFGKNTTLSQHNTVNSSRNVHNTTAGSFQPSAPSFSDIVREQDISQPSPATSSGSFKPLAPSLEDVHFQQKPASEGQHAPSAPPLPSGGAASLHQLDPIQFGHIGWNHGNAGEIKKENTGILYSQNLNAPKQAATSEIGWITNQPGDQKLPYPTNIPQQGAPSPIGLNMNRGVYTQFHQEATPQRQHLPYPVNVDSPIHHPIIQSQIQTSPNYPRQQPHLEKSPFQTHLYPGDHNQQFYSHQYPGPSPPYPNQPQIVEAIPPPYQPAPKLLYPVQAPHSYGTGFTTPYIPPPPPPGYTYQPYSSIQTNKDSKHKDIMLGLALWQLTKQSNHHHHHYDQQQQQHYYYPSVEKNTFEYEEPYVSYQSRYNPRPNVVGSHNTIVITNFVSNTTSKNGSMVGTMVCRTTYNLGAVKRWVNRTALDFRRQYPLEKFPEMVNGTLVNFTVVPGNIIHNETALVTCCGTTGPPVPLSYLINGKARNVNCITKLGKIPLRKMIFIKHSTNETSNATTPNPFDGPWVPITLIKPENTTTNATANNTETNSTSSLDANVSAMIVNMTSIPILVHNNKNSTLSTATLSTTKALVNTASQNTAPGIAVTQSPSDLLIG